MTTDNKSPCDFTRPLTAEEKKAVPPGLRNAQYSLTGRPFIEGVKTVDIDLAVGLDFPTATRWERRLSDLMRRLYPHHFHSNPYFGVQLRMPVYTKNVDAQVGDLVLRQFATEPRPMQDAKVFVETLIVGQVTAVKEGKVTEFVDRTGKNSTLKKPYYIFAAGQFDLSAAVADLSERDGKYLADGSFGEPHGSYASPASMAHVLRPHLIPVQPTMPSGIAVSAVMGFDVDIAPIVA